MKVALLAGGFGTRLSEETHIKPKPMVEIGGRPIMWHIMKYYAHFGLRDFVVLGGYKVEYIRNYFLNYRANECDFTVDLKSGGVEWAEAISEDWRVTVIDTGFSTMTGGRLKRAQHLLGDAPFCLTYGDGLSTVNIPELLASHQETGAWCTLTAVVQPGRYGALRLSDEGTQVRGFREKGTGDGGLINGGFFVCNPEILNLIDGDDSVLEEQVMDRLIERGKLGSFRHEGFWQSMDSLRDRHVLEEQWARGAPWKVWS
jgi:glucose-1-phosphate cytidylyltransferase